MALFALLLALAGRAGWADPDSIAPIVRLGLFGGAAASALGLILGFLNRSAGAMFGARCPRCKRPVRRGAIYCPDHLQETIREAKEKYHRDHGSGI